MQLVPEYTENENKDRLRNQIIALRSGNRIAILDALREIRTQSNVSILPELFELLLDEENEEIIQGVTSLLNDLKVQDAAPVLTEAIANPEYHPIARILVAACWQNGLSYGKYADTFTRVAIEADFATSIEAFTVLEAAVGEIDRDQRNRLSEQIRNSLPAGDDQKRLLLRELIKVMETY